MHQMDRKKTSSHDGHLNRRSFLNAASRLAGGGLAVGATFEGLRPGSAWGQQPAKETHASSARVLDRLKARFSFQISVDVVVTPASAISKTCFRKQGPTLGQHSTSCSGSPGMETRNCARWRAARCWTSFPTSPSIKFHGDIPRKGCLPALTLTDEACSHSASLLAK